MNTAQFVLFTLRAATRTWSSKQNPKWNRRISRTMEIRSLGNDKHDSFSVSRKHCSLFL